MLRLPLNTPSPLMILMIWSILALWLCIALARSPLLTFCTPLRGKRRKVFHLVHHFFFFFAGMTTKFNQDMYAKMRSKKNEPLSNLGKRTVHVIGKGPPITPTILVAPAVPNTETTRTASSATSVEEITTPVSKRLCLTDKGKEKVDSCSSRIWDDVELVVEKAYEVVTTEDLKVFSSTPSNKVMACHVHKLVQVTYLCNFIPFFLFSFFIVLKAPIFFSSAGEESSHHLGVPHLGSQGRVCDVQDGGFGGEELQTKERPNCHYRRGQHH